ncbi:MAG: hypothetical protein ACXWF8_09060 [Methylobacter sp.]
MDLYDLRRKLRRIILNRRIEDRRKIPYPFGSQEWIENIKQNYLAWPKTNRRIADRRAGDRRAHDRRQYDISEQQRSEQRFSSILLTDEEKRLIEDLFLNDPED